MHLASVVSVWKHQCNKMKGNRFVPYFKEAYVPYFFEMFISEFRADCAGKNREIIARLEIMNAKQKKHGGGVFDHEKYYANMTFLAIDDVYSCYLTLDRPSQKFLPDYVQGSDIGYTNDFLIYTFFIR